MIQLSIIIPVYNTEKVLNRCLESCLQAIKKSSFSTEIIIVNDGSPDNAQDIINFYIEKYPFISCIKQTNQGLSTARNNGLKKALGEYIWFIDSDDTINSNSLSVLKQYLSPEIDVFSFNYNLIYEINNKTILKNPPINFSNGQDVLLSKKQPMGAPFYIYKREYLIKNNLYFLSHVYHEDNEFNFKMLFKAGKFKKIDSQFYNYYIYSKGTITSTSNIKKSLDLIKIANLLKEFIESNANSSQNNNFYYYVGLCLSTAYHNAKRCPKNDKVLFYKTINNTLIQSCMKYKYFKHIILAIILYIKKYVLC